MQESNKIFDTVGIIGVGLIGGSLGMALKAKEIADKVIGFGRNEQRLMKAKLLGAIDEYSLSYDQIAQSDLIIICTPVRLVSDTLKDISKYLKPGTIITDVSSTKRQVVDSAKLLTPPGCFFVGGHPMAGSEKTGVEAASPDLFVGATYVITPDETIPASIVAKMTNLIDAIGARVEIMEPLEHDRTVAVISHLPHVISAALVHLTENEEQDTSNASKLVAGSFRDLTRVTDSSPVLWRDICLSNADTICKSIDDFQQILSEFKDNLLECKETQIYDFFEDAKEIRRIIMRKSK